MKLRLILTVIVALVTVMVLFFAAKTSDTLATAAPEDSTPVVEEQVQIEEVTLQEPEVQADEEEPEPVARAQIEDSYRLTTKTVVHSGMITNSLTGERIPGELVEVCDDNEVNSFDIDGEFKVEYSCRPGQTAWLEFDFGGKTYHTNHVVMPYPARISSSGSAAAVETVHAPEFSAATLAVVVIGGCLGLALLRKQ